MKNKKHLIGFLKKNNLLESFKLSRRLFFFKTIILWLLIVLPLNVIGQTNFRLLEQYIIETHQLLKTAFIEGNAEQQQIFAQKLQKQILFVLVQEEAFEYQFLKLRQYIHIIESDDKKMRIFSWDALQGGDWRKMVALAQYKGVANNILVKELSPEQFDLTNFKDVCYHDIYTIQGDKTYYLLIGTGSHGSGQHHATIQLLHFKDDKLLECEGCFEFTQQSLELQYPCNQSIEVLYNKHRQILSFLDYESSSLRREFKRLHWIEGQFKDLPKVN